MFTLIWLLFYRHVFILFISWPEKMVSCFLAHPFILPRYKCHGSSQVGPKIWARTAGLFPWNLHLGKILFISQWSDFSVSCSQQKYSMILFLNSQPESWVEFSFFQTIVFLKENKTYKTNHYYCLFQTWSSWLTIFKNTKTLCLYIYLKKKLVWDS